VKQEKRAKRVEEERVLALEKPEASVATACMHGAQSKKCFLRALERTLA
jgi:hypothetical protein